MLGPAVVDVQPERSVRAVARATKARMRIEECILLGFDVETETVGELRYFPKRRRTSIDEQM